MVRTVYSIYVFIYVQLIITGIHKGGWHFSYFGDADHIRNKLMNFAHQEYNADEYLQSSYIMECIQQNKDLFHRKDMKMRMINVSDNVYLPVNVELLMQLFNQSEG